MEENLILEGLLAAVNKKILVSFDLSCVDRVVKRGYDFEAEKQPVSRKDDARVILCTRSRERHRRQGVSDGGAAFGGHGGAVRRAFAAALGAVMTRRAMLPPIWSAKPRF